MKPASSVRAAWNSAASSALDDAEAHGAERHAEQKAFHLRLAAEDVDDEQQQAARRGQAKETGDQPLDPRTVSHGVFRRRSIQRVTPISPTR